MRFSLQDVRKSIQRRGGVLAVSLYFLRPGILQVEIERLIAYFEGLLGQPQSQFSVDEARAYIGDYRLAHCLIATLSAWYSWQTRDWVSVVKELGADAQQPALSSPIQLRLALYMYVNAHYNGFLSEQQRPQALQTFAQELGISSASLEVLLHNDSEEEARLIRTGERAPTASEVAILYNQWAFEAALFTASEVRLVIDCNAFVLSDASVATSGAESSWLKGQGSVGLGAGAAIKRLCYLARRMGVYYDLAYEGNETDLALDRPLQQNKPLLLNLTLYGPQEVTGLPQQYGLRLARLCRFLLGYRTHGGQGRASLGKAVVAASARVHFLQRTYMFAMDANLLQLLPSVPPGTEREGEESNVLFDSSIEQAFAEAFLGASASQGVDGWHLEREPEPLLLDRSIFIPDFAFSRGTRRIYGEILGFWTPAYRERKIQKLQQLRGRQDLLLAIPEEAKEVFTPIANDFPIVYYTNQLSLAEVLQVLRSHYDDFAERLAQVDLEAVQAQVWEMGLCSERTSMELLQCYRRSELLKAVERVCDNTGGEILFVSGLGLFTQTWMHQALQSFTDWMQQIQSCSLADAIRELQIQQPGLQSSEETSIETLIGLWSEIRIQRDSIFEARVELVHLAKPLQETAEQDALTTEEAPIAGDMKKSTRQKRAPSKKRPRAEPETIQENLW
ncbi:DUF790 family protein [Tengunoibacter tsumagoiensis]|uniref:DUF790 family protein n=1 Tax=Tengunoibacter tsumagoiensis TaxID=2014871 RepID=A0A401ZX28_9CHLR|nr:DUF790 family protein [Tengunoibacter tsumagoiensis]GCE11392.1 hypothetical protein KTT_12510 [Tengunoibacter tsumagoiensis]